MKWLINPFERVAGWQALFIGLTAMALTAIFGKINLITFDGVLDVKFAVVTFSLSTSFIIQSIIFLILFLIIWLAGICFSKSKPRAIDIAGTMALARIPMLLFVIVCFLPIVPDSLVDFPRMIVFSIIGILFLIWMVALMYNAYAVSCHLKGQRAVISFIGAVIVVELISKFIFIVLAGFLFANEPIKNIVKVETAETVVITDSLTIQQKTENIVRAYERSDFDVITAYFDDNMKKRLTSRTLKTTWIQLNMQFGQFVRADLDNLKETVTQQNVIVNVPFYFQKEKMTLQLAFNKDGLVGGMYIRKAE